MLESIVVLSKVSIVCAVGFAVATGFEWFSDVKVKPQSSMIKLGKNKNNPVVSDNDIKIENLRKKSRHAG